MVLAFPEHLQHRNDARVIQKLRRQTHHLQGPEQVELADPGAVLGDKSPHDAAQPGVRRGRRGNQAGVAKPLRRGQQGVLRPHSSHREARQVDDRQRKLAKEGKQSGRLRREGVGRGI